MRRLIVYLWGIICVATLNGQQSWTADNGNGNYTNPLFYDEFSDPDIIRVGEDYYLAGTTMHCTPGLVILHSKDLVNWKFLSYCFNRFDMGDSFRLQNDKEAYGQGIWAPCIRYHDDTFYVFSNINGVGLQVFTSKDPAGPWHHKNMGGNIYDLSILFDDDGKIYAVHGYDEVKITEIKPDFSGYVEGSERTIIPAGNAMGEGHHIYKIDEKYYILSADYSPMGRMQCARSNHINGPYETTAISVKETLGTERVNLVTNVGLGSLVPKKGFKFDVYKPSSNDMGCATLHQGGIVQLPNGDWWGVSMLDFRSVGRTTCLSPITWEDGWPYFGLPGNLGRTPRTWIKPETGFETMPYAPYDRSDNFGGKALQPIWQWNHEPDDKNWELTNGKLRLKTLPAKDLMWAKNTLTQRCIGPKSIVTTIIDASRLKEGDMAGLALMNLPYAMLGVKKENKEYLLEWYNQNGDRTLAIPLNQSKLLLRIEGDYDNDLAQFSYSMDGEEFIDIGSPVLIPYQLKTFQGGRHGLFAYNMQGKKGGYVDFEEFIVEEPMADRTGNLPIGRVVRLMNKGNGTYVWANPHGMLHSANADSPQYNKGECQFKVLDRGQGRVVLQTMNGTGYVSVVGVGLSADVRLVKEENETCLIQWQDMLYDECMLLSLKNNRYIGVDPTTGEPYGADWMGSSPNRMNGVVFKYEVVD